MKRPRNLIWFVLAAGIGYSIWRWRKSQSAESSTPVVPTPLPKPTPPSLVETREPTLVISKPAADAPANGAPRRIATRVYRGAPPSSARPALVAEAEVAPPAETPVAPEESVDSPVAAEAPAAVEEAPAAVEEASAVVAVPPVGPVNINTADLQTLIDLPGIGPALAARIIAYRDEKGPFATVDSLVDVQGIGPNNINEFRSLITAE